MTNFFGSPKNVNGILHLLIINFGTERKDAGEAHFLVF